MLSLLDELVDFIFGLLGFLALSFTVRSGVVVLDKLKLDIEDSRLKIQKFLFIFRLNMLLLQAVCPQTTNLPLKSEKADTLIKNCENCENSKKAVQV